MIRYLAESEKFKVYSIYESVYLKNKMTTQSQNDFDNQDLFIAWHYGDPNDAIILRNEKYVVVSGCGISIYDIENKVENHILDDADDITWTNGLHQDDRDDQDREVRFVSFYNEDKLRVFKIDLLSTLVKKME